MYDEEGVDERFLTGFVLGLFVGIIAAAFIFVLLR